MHMCTVIKNGMLDDPYNYCPVSILPSVSKILKKLILNQLFTFLEK